jgi:hypothetical protein
MLHWLLQSPCSWLSSTDMGHFRLSFHRPQFELAGVPLRRSSPSPSHFPSSCLHFSPFISFFLLCLILLILHPFFLCFRRPTFIFSFSVPFFFFLFVFPSFYPRFILHLLSLSLLHIAAPFRFKSPLPAVLLLIHFTLRFFPTHSIHVTTSQYPTHNAVHTIRRRFLHLGTANETVPTVPCQQYQVTVCVITTLHRRILPPRRCDYMAVPASPRHSL